MLVGWWKLDGDARDSSGQGSHGTPSNITWADGKIGQCGNFNGTNSVISLTSEPLQKRVFTMSAWIKTDGLAPDTTLAGIFSMSYSCTMYLNGSGQFTFRCEGAHSAGDNLFDNKWHHVAATYDGSYKRMYVDGVEIHSVATDFNPGYFAPSSIGTEVNYTAKYRYMGLIDDVRLYDHALSPKEIKELAQAKILHYKFDDFQEPTRNMLIGGGEPVTSSSYAIKDYPLVEPLVEGRTYTVSMKATLGEGKSYFGLYNSGGSVSVTSLAGAQLGEDGVYRRTFTWQVGSSANTYLRVYHMPSSAVVDSTVEWIQVEEKDHPTPFVDDTRGGMVCDCSGYDNHGSLELATTPQWVSESKIGTGCYQFDGETSHILVNATTMDSLVANDFSITFWLNSNDVTGLTRDVLGGGNYGNTYGGVAFSHHSGNTWYYDIYTEPSGRHALTISDSSNIIPFNQWSHIVLSRNRSNSSQSIHVNGVKVGERTVAGSEDIRWNQSAFPLKIGKGHYNGTNGMIDDVRIYTTALSDADVLDLYRDSASIDNRGCLHAHQAAESTLNRCPDFSQWSLSGSSIDSDGSLIISKGGYAQSPFMYIGPDSRWTFSAEYYSDEQSQRADWQPDAGYLLGSTYFDACKASAQNSSGYAGNGHARRYPTGQWTKGTWSDVGGPNVHYIRMRISESASYTPTTYKVRNPMITVTGYNGDYMPYSAAEVGSSTPTGVSIESSGTMHVNNISEIGPARNMIGWWPLDGHADDLSGGNNHGTVYGAAVTTGINGMAYSFDGVDDYVCTGVLPATNEFTLSMWFKPLTPDIGARLCWGAGTDKAIIHIATGNRLAWYTKTSLGNTGYRVTNLTYDPDHWNFVCLSYSGVMVQCHINGVKDAVEASITGDSITSAINIATNYAANGSFFKGIIQDVRAYSRALSPEEIKILYSATKPNPVAMQLSNTGVVYIPGQLKEV